MAEAGPEEKASTLNRNHGHLLIDDVGDPRGRFLVVSTELLEVLRKPWGLKTANHENNRNKIAKRMRPVQRYTPQIRQRNMNCKGLVANDEFNGMGKVPEVAARNKINWVR